VKTDEGGDMRHRLARIGLVALLVVPAAGAIACDKEDVKDVEEVGNDIENEVDKADTDGKDD
jgi:hypothetical protein